MMFLTSLITVLIAPFVIPAPAPSPGNTGPPPGYQTVENTCSTPEVLFCCNGDGFTGVGLGGILGAPTLIFTGCQPAMIGNPPSTATESGYCPATGGYKAECCSASLSLGVATGCGLPTQS